ncbi:hypothetical protein BC829DRAFT_503 [Chytridium lagenaria]|nr:hypothetical protein BC829DRAFT_503 [Chytridium lagenaria]
MSSFSQKHLQAMLSELMSSSCGSLSPDVDITNGYEIQSVCSGFAVGMITLAKGHLINEKNDVNAVRINVVEDLVRLISARTQGQSSKHNAYHSPVGAIIAIMLMFLKSNDAAMAEELHLPQTLHLLDYSRYDVILLKTLGRNLIMWDSIEPADIWFCSQIPDYIKSLSVSSAESLKRGEYTFRDGAAASAYVESTRQAYLGILAGACLSLGLKLAGTACPIGFKAIMDKIRFVSKEINLNGLVFHLVVINARQILHSTRGLVKV